MVAAKDFVGVSFDNALSSVRGGHPSNLFYTGPTPAELRTVYSRGFQGITRPVPETRTLIQDFKGSMPSLYEAFPWAKGMGKGKALAPYLSLLHFDSNWGGDEAQTRGSCTVHSNTNAAMMDYANDAFWGETQWMGRLVKENVYRSRGYSGDGWSCYAPALYVGPTGKGGFLYRKSYESPSGDSVDFTEFSRATEDWAGRGRNGCPGWLEEISRDNKAKWIIPITTLEEYRDALALGFGISVCSGYGFSSSTDEFGLARARGSWSHAMAHVAVNDTAWAHSKYGGMIGMIQQSWGEWNTINGKPEGSPKMPIGGFYVSSKNIGGMLREDDSFAVCSVYGYDRVGFEAFDTVNLLTHLRNSTTQDYYKDRADSIATMAERALSGDEFLAI